MEQHQLGRTGVSVSKLCLGAMMFGAWGNPEHDESIRIIHAALDAGINFIDTADVYGHGESEEIVGKALAGGRRDDVILATKFHNLDAVEQLAQLADEAGITLIELAIACVLNHPAITAALVGPRTMEQLEGQLAAADVVLEEAVLDRIDAIVTPGITINPADNSWNNPALAPAARRR